MYITDYENINRLRRALTGRAKEFGDCSHVVKMMIDTIRAFLVIKEDKYDRLITFYDMITNLIQGFTDFQ